MTYFDRFDICEAYLALEWDYHAEGWLRERPSNARRMMSTDVQLRRMQFKPGVSFNGFASLSENGKEIYHAQVVKLGLPVPECCQCVEGRAHDDDCDHRCEKDYCENWPELL